MVLFMALRRRIYACLGIQFQKNGMVQGARRFCCALEMCSWRMVVMSKLPFGLLSHMHHESQAYTSAGI